MRTFNNKNSKSLEGEDMDMLDTDVYNERDIIEETDIECKPLFCVNIQNIIKDWLIALLRNM